MKSDGEVTGAEALVRWIQPQRGMVSPVDFIPIAEQSGIIFEIGNWVMLEASSQIKKWSDSGLLTHGQVISVNVSPREFLRDDFIPQVIKVIRGSGINPKQLCLELTEGTYINDIPTSIDKINLLKKIGIKCSIDDFGTGYSSLSYLLDLNISELKIDRSFVKHIGMQEYNTIIVDMIIEMAQKLNLQTVIEGVETKDQIDYFVSKNCRIFQGFYFSKPLTTEGFCELLKKHRTIALVK